MLTQQQVPTLQLRTGLLLTRQMRTRELLTLTIANIDNLTFCGNYMHSRKCRCKQNKHTLFLVMRFRFENATVHVILVD